MTVATQHPIERDLDALKDFKVVETRSVTHDGTPAILVRRERADGVSAGLGGEHVSTLVADDGRLLGVTHMRADLAGLPTVSRERAAEVAEEFLLRHAPDLMDAREVLWIDAHPETVRVEGGETQVTGMKVKQRDTRTGLYFWVIVGGDGSVVTFERDIYWITFPGKRRTEKWLHDSWRVAGG
ncbi:hypothetical protein C882_1151 [Caenispirillum salinarum AK4]|uniref:Uncharacterized protein n=1 Tax=Caenispirillum salinarum AK4 TaxID=1238182 RepID=K9GQE4_9PROT|nr:hypothetical protein [Caenispirillum salinarum]EKV28150.1 hypothetical protein C882_1151 [Caenispirillum salinarum AK4]